MYNIKRDGSLIASDVEEKTYTDTGLESGTEYTYTVEIDGVEDSEATVNTKTTEQPTILVSSRELEWDDLPAWNQPNNGSLTLLSSEVKDNVPVIVETGKTVERLNFRTREVQLVPETVVQYETRAVYTYKADFEWDNRFDTLNEDDLDDPNINWDNWRELPWLVDVLQFKNNKLRSGFAAFFLMPAAQLTALPDLDTSNLTSMISMFGRTDKFNQEVDSFDTSNVTNMEGMFDGAFEFNQELDNFNTSNVTDMFGMFLNAKLFNKPLNFNTSNVKDMQYMFTGAENFSQPLDWNTRNVTNMQAMFYAASSFNMPLKFDTSSVTDMFGMFWEASAFDQPLDNWNTSKVTNMASMFMKALRFRQDISNWCVSQIASKPTGFDRLAGFADQDDKQPKWGQPC